MELHADNLACARGGRLVFAGLTFALRAGEALLLRGPNGSGKTSLLRLIAGLLEPAAGSLRLDGGHRDLGIGQQAHYVGHADAVKPALTVAENLGFWGALLGGGDAEGALASFGLAHLAGAPAALLSAGQKRRLALSRLALVPRALWLLDEPSTALDSASQQRLAAIMGEHRGAGGLIVAATHAGLGLEFDRALELAAAGTSA